MLHALARAKSLPSGLCLLNKVLTPSCVLCLCLQLWPVAMSASPWDQDSAHVALTPPQGSTVAQLGAGNGAAMVGGPSTPSSSDEDQKETAESMATDAEGVWSPDIEQSFQEALAIYPPCGRRKIILSDEGKMYGRNELIARYIKLRTGKVRTRKQVSSHIQVLARKKQRELQVRLKETPLNSEQEAIHAYLQSAAGMSSAEVVSSSGLLSPSAKGVHGAVGSGSAVETDPATTANMPHNMAMYNNSEPMPQLQNHSTMPTPGAQPLPMGFPAQGGGAPTSPGNVFIKKERSRWMTDAPSSATHSFANASDSLRKQPIAGPSANIVYGSSSVPPASMYPGMAAISSPPPSGAAFSPPPHLRMLSPGGTPLPPLLQPASSFSGRFQLTEFSAFVEQKSVSEVGRPQETRLHQFIHIPPGANFTKPNLETIDVRQVGDKFPGIGELFSKGPKDSFFLVKFWADMDVPVQEDANAFYGSTTTYEAAENLACSCSTKVCSFGKQVVEKVETQQACLENGRYVVRLVRSPMCEYMINFIHKLQGLPERSMMNSVLENFTILQLVTKRDSNELLLCIAFMFEVSTNVQGADYRIYRLVKE